MGEELPRLYWHPWDPRMDKAMITITGQQQVTHFFPEFSLFLLHHLLILTSDMTLILVKPTLTNLTGEFEEWNKIISLVPGPK